jgi:hypothetical protein
VGERVGHDVALSLLLQRVVADRVGGGEGFFDVAGFQDVFHPLRVIGPDAGEVVGLEFQSHGEAVVLRVADAAVALWTLSLRPNWFCTWWPTS